MLEYFPITDRDAECLEQLCREFSPNAKILEVGCGRSSDILAKHGRLTIVDVDDERIIQHPYATRVRTDSLDFKTSEMFDLVFIDADHTYRYIKHDIDNLFQNVRVGGILCGHDYEGLPFDERHVDSDYVDGKHHGVIKAVSERFNNVGTFQGSSIWWVKK